MLNPNVLREMGNLMGGTASEFSEVHPWNMPGPVYTCGTDNCGTGVLCAPNNVCEDESAYEFVFRQPETMYELDQLKKAAYCDPFEAYRFNGLSFWSKKSVRSWWGRRSGMLSYARSYRLDVVGEKYNYAQGAMLMRWVEYIELHGQGYVEWLISVVPR
jgi:hypothetical protein